MEKNVLRSPLNASVPVRREFWLSAQSMLGEYICLAQTSSCVLHRYVHPHGVPEEL